MARELPEDIMGSPGAFKVVSTKAYVEVTSLKVLKSIWFIKLNVLVLAS